MADYTKNDQKKKKLSIIENPIDVGDQLWRLGGEMRWFK